MPKTFVDQIVYPLFRLLRRELYVSDDRNTVIIRAKNSARALHYIQDLFDTRRPIHLRQGAPLRIIAADIDGKNRTVTITGRRGLGNRQREFRLTIEDIGSGTSSTDTTNLASILAELGFGDHSAIFRRLITPRFEDQPAWRQIHTFYTRQPITDERKPDEGEKPKED